MEITQSEPRNSLMARSLNVFRLISSSGEGTTDSIDRHRVMKRVFDLVVGVPIFCILCPVMIAIASILRIAMGGPAFFKQQRPGLHGKAFTLYKLRTMRGERGVGGSLLPDGDRLTRLGRVLRVTSLDELPGLLNVLKGDMSLVGPRPLLMQYLEKYTPEQARRHEVKPGLTGWAQVNGRNAISWEEKFRLDVWYVDHQSFWLDLKIIGKTIKKVLKREGISAAGEATMPEFVGTEVQKSDV